MQAYHNNEEIKQKYIERMKAHIAADELIRGYGYKNGKGCFIGCTLNHYSHLQFEKELGVPRWLARVFDTIYEGANINRSARFALEILESINVGSDLERIKAPFLIFILEFTLDTFDHSKYPKIFDSVNNIIRMLKLNGYVASYAAAAADDAANAYAAAADAHAIYYAAHAYAAAAATAAVDAVYAVDAVDAVYAVDAVDADADDPVDVAAAAAAAAFAVYYAARAATSAVYYAARAAASEAYDADDADADDARVSSYEKFANKLIALIKECK